MCLATRLPHIETRWKRIDNGLLTRWQHIGKMLATHWQRVGNTLATRWQNVGNALVTCWRNIGNALATSTTWPNVAQCCQLVETVHQISPVWLSICPSICLSVCPFFQPFVRLLFQTKIKKSLLFNVFKMIGGCLPRVLKIFFNYPIMRATTTTI